MAFMTDQLREAPNLVVYGDHDPVRRLPPGHALRDAIPGVTLLTREGAGSDTPSPPWDVIVSALLQHAGGGRP